MPVVSQHRQRRRRDELVFERHDIHQRRELQQLARVVPVTDDGVRVETVRGKILLAFDHDHFATELRSGGGGHFGELPAANDAKTRHRHGGQRSERERWVGPVHGQPTK
jgi:hypothetical protein